MSSAEEKRQQEIDRYLQERQGTLSKIALPKVWTAGEIEMTEFPPIRYIVPGLIPEGETVLAGAQKIGKSLLCLSLAATISTGGTVLGEIEVPQNEVLYVPLEDGPRRIQDRLQKMGLFPDHKNLRFVHQWPRGENGLLALEKYLSEFRNTKLIIIDPLAKILPIGTDGNDYNAVYDAATRFKDVADFFGIGIILVHHVKKAGGNPDGDFVERIIGSTGLTACADTIVTVARGRGKADGILKCTGRDIEEQELALNYNTATLQWEILGEAREIQRTRDRQELFDLLRQADRPLKTSEIAKSTGKSDSNISHILNAMKSEGIVDSPKYGQWEASVQSDPVEPIQSNQSIQSENDNETNFEYFEHFEGTSERETSEEEGELDIF